MPGDFDLQRGGAVGAQPLRQPVGHGGGLGLLVVLAFVLVRGFAFAAETLPQPFQRAQRLGFGCAAARDESRPARCGRW
jgi:hypothetical protein